MFKRLLVDKLFLLSILLAPFSLWLFLATTNPLINNNIDIGWKSLVFSILLYPILEEIIFRGWLQNSLLAKNMNKTLLGISAANLVTSVIFAGLHLYSKNPLIAAAIFIPSLVFGFFYERYKSVIPCIMLHSIYNMVFVGAAVLRF